MLKRTSKRNAEPVSPPRRAAWLKATLTFVFVIAVAGIGFLVRYRAAKASTGSGPTPPASQTLIAPESQIRSAYAGSASCRDCHQEAYALWAGSHHGLAERVPTEQCDRNAFVPARTFSHGTQTTSVGAQGDQFQITSVGLSRQPELQTVARVIGEDPLRQFLVSTGNGRYQAMEAAFDPHRGEWFNVYGQEDRQPGEWGHWTGRGMNWNDMCAGCHNTRVRKNYDPSADSYHTTMSEMSVGCEACHGPLAAHRDWQNRFGKTGQSDPTVVKLDRQRMLDTCGACHARRSELTGDFQPGDDFLDQYELAIVDDTETFYPDGQIHEEDYEYSSFLGSRMHFRGVTCMDCHQPHSSKTRLPGNWLCMRCHTGTYPNAPAIEPVSHSHHNVFGYDPKGAVTNFDLTGYDPKTIKETGGECVNCHMPQTVYMQRYWRHDHGFTIPDPLLTQESGIPNSCNRCHKDKDTAWAQATVEKWYGARMERPSRKRARWIARARAGDPAARDPLIALSAQEELPYWRAAAVTLLSSWAEQKPVRDTLLRGMEDTNALVRAKAAHALEPLLEQSDDLVRQALQRHLDDPKRSVRMSAAWALRGTLEQGSLAARELAQSLQLHADQPSGQVQIGAYAWARKDSENAIRHIQRAIEWDPNSAPIRHELAVMLSSAGRTREAVEQLEAACRLEPRQAEYRYKLGLAWNELGDSARTIESLEQAVKLAPRHARALYNLGLAYNSRGNTEMAIETLTRAASAAPEDARIPYAQATIYAHLGQMAQARTAAARALELEPGFVEAKELLQQLQ